MAIPFNPPQVPREEDSIDKLNRTLEILNAYAQQRQQRSVQRQALQQANLGNYLKLLETDPQLVNTPIGQQIQARMGGGLGGYQPPTASTGTVPSPDALPAPGGSPIIAAFNSLQGRGTMGQKAQAQMKSGIEMQKLAQDVSPRGLYDQTGKFLTNLPPGAQVVPPREMGGQGKAPTGFRFTADGNLEAIPGGPVAIKQAEAEAKEKGLMDAAVRQADTVMAKVDEALGKVGGTTTGLIGSVAGKIPGTTGYDLRQDIDTIKANLGFRELQEMRRNSPTGGALGQIAVRELDFLQATIASLDPGQSPPQITKNLNDIKSSYQRWRDAVSGQGGQSAHQQTTFSADKEARYQAWKASQGR